MAGGWRYQTHPDQAAYVERFVLEGQTAKLSAAALETLAIVAYKQPISRAQVASIRGVSVDGVMRTLQQRGYIAEVGRDPGPGQAVMYGTTAAVPREGSGLDSLDDLPAARRLRSRGRRGRAARAGASGPTHRRSPSGWRRSRAPTPTRDGDLEGAGSPTGEPTPAAEPVDLDAELGVDRRPRRPGDRPPASGCRRCWPRRASAAAGPART